MLEASHDNKHCRWVFLKPYLGVILRALHSSSGVCHVVAKYVLICANGPSGSERAPLNCESQWILIFSRTKSKNLI